MICMFVKLIGFTVASNSRLSVSSRRWVNFYFLRECRLYDRSTSLKRRTLNLLSPKEWERLAVTS